jgi:predicted nucleic acid-binding protein
VASALPIHEDDGATRGLMSVVLDLARRHSLSAYDAAYLDLALREKLLIATLDAKLRSASAAAGLAIFATA